MNIYLRSARDFFIGSAVTLGIMASVSLYNDFKQQSQESTLQENLPKKESTLELETRWANQVVNQSEKYWWMGQAALCMEYGKASSPQLQEYCQKIGHVYLGNAGFKAEDSLYRLLEVSEHPELVNGLDKKLVK